MFTTETKQRFELIANALNCSGGFANGNYLIPHKRESLARFELRKQKSRSFFTEFKSLCTSYVGYLAKSQPSRDIGDNMLIGQFMDDCDRRGTGFDIWMYNLAIEAKARGSMGVLVEMPEVVSESVGLQVERREIPWLVMIYPEDVIDFELTDDGAFAYIEMDSTELVEGKQKPVVRRWDTEKWSVLLDGKELRGGYHGLGMCPVIPFTESGDFPFFGEFSSIANICLDLLHFKSCLQELLDNQAFSMFVMQVEKEDLANFDPEKLKQMNGTNNMTLYTGERPGYVSSDPGQPASLQAKIDKLQEDMKRVGRADMLSSGSAAESAEALRERFQSLNASLAMFASRMEGFERRLWQVIGRWLGLDLKVTVSYPRDFAVTDIQYEIMSLQQLQSCAMPDAVIKAAKKKLVQAMFAGLNENELQLLLNSVEEHTLEPVNTESNANTVKNDVVDQ